MSMGEVMESKCISLDQETIDYVESERQKRHISNWSEALRVLLREKKEDDEKK